MGLDPQLREMLNQEVALYPRAGNNAYGQAAWDAKVTLTARVEASSRLVRDSDGNLIGSTVTIFTVDPPSRPRLHDEVVLPDGRRLTVTGVESMPDENGDEYYVAVYAS